MKNATIAVVIIALFIPITACRNAETPAPAAGTSTPAVVPPTETTAAAPSTDTAATGAEYAEISSKLASYAAAGLDGMKYEVGSRKGKVVLLNVWATWCGPCRFEIPELNRLQQKYATKDFEVVGVTIDERGQEEAVRQFAKDQSFSYRVVLDPGGEIATILKTTTIPTTVLIGRDGAVKWYHVGIVQMNDPEFQQALASAL